MEIRFTRSWSPGDMGEAPCILCEQPFVVESVMATTSLESQVACPSCVEYFGKRNPEKFPTIEEYGEAKRRYPEPMQDADAFDDVDHQASWLWRAPG